MMATGSRTKSLAVALMYGRMGASTLVNGSIITCTVVESTHGRTVVDTRASTIMTENTVLVFTRGPMAASTMACGRMASSMVRVNIYYRLAYREEVHGEMGSERSGSTQPAWFRARQGRRTALTRVVCSTVPASCTPWNSVHPEFKSTIKTNYLSSLHLILAHSLYFVT